MHFCAAVERMSLALSVSPLLFFTCVLLGVIQGQAETGEVQLVYRQVIHVEKDRSLQDRQLAFTL